MDITSDILVISKYLAALSLPEKEAVEYYLTNLVDKEKALLEGVGGLDQASWGTLKLDKLNLKNSGDVERFMRDMLKKAMPLITSEDLTWNQLDKISRDVNNPDVVPANLKRGVNTMSAFWQSLVVKERSMKKDIGKAKASLSEFVDYFDSVIFASDYSQDDLAEENVTYKDTGGVSDVASKLHFQPAFKSVQTGEVMLSRYEDGSMAPFHTLEGLPEEYVIERDEDGFVTRVQPLVAGFVKDGEFFSREEAAIYKRKLDAELGHAASLNMDSMLKSIADTKGSHIARLTDRIISGQKIEMSSDIREDIVSGVYEYLTSI